MIIHDKMVEVIRNALVDYESATGLECQIRYADRLSAVVEVVLELAEEMPETVARTPIVSRMPAVEVVPLGAPNTTEPQTENQTETKASEPPTRANAVDKAQIHDMLRAGVPVGEIVKKLGVSQSVVYYEKDKLKKQEAK
jgi:hypothetical protein